MGVRRKNVLNDDYCDCAKPNCQEARLTDKHLTIPMGLLRHVWTEWNGIQLTRIKRYNSTSQVRIIHPEESSLPVQCETNPTGLNGVVVFDDLTYAIPSVDNQQPIDRAPSLDNLTGVSVGLEQQWSSEETHHQ
ncbi:hypothetical protein PFLUV_G00130590 [Perca fluviatilis]|uniref:Uncharacterized protein n=1 Tax=Perca fluviatilis TaxID=8168 RepID=A0A6A5EY69_PERFL|nr:hypothetical protein PFLUV_G00130590 [Perca fluviatilis]